MERRGLVGAFDHVWFGDPDPQCRLCPLRWDDGRRCRMFGRVEACDIAGFVPDGLVQLCPGQPIGLERLG